MLDRLKLRHYGNAIPDIRAVISTSATPVTLDEVVDDILDRVELEVRDSLLDNQFNIQRNTSGLSGVTVRGVTFRAGTSPIDMLKTLSIAYNLVMQDRGGKLHFYLRQDAPEVTISTDALASHRFGDEFDRPISVQQAKPDVIPSEVNVRYIDRDLDYETASQREVRESVVDYNVKSVDLAGVVMTDDEARAVAAKFLHTAAVSKNRGRVNLPFSYAYAIENDVLKWTDTAGHPWRLLVERVDQTNEGILEFEGVEDSTATLSYSRTVNDRDKDTAQEIPTPADIELIPFEVGPFLVEDATQPTLYLAAAQFDSDAEFTGYTLYQSNDNSTFVEVGEFYYEQHVGYATTALSAPVVTGVWDEVNTVTVEMYQGTLSTKTDEEVLVHRDNWALIGQEVIAFRTVADNGDGTYTLSGLLRGLLNTADTVGTHAANEPFVMLGDPPVDRYVFTASDIGQTVYFKAVPDGEDEANVLPVSHTFAGETVKPWPVANIRGIRTTAAAFTQGITIDWERVSREPGTLLGDRPLLESVERYQVQILDSAGAGGGSVIATYLTQDKSQIFYSNTQQTSDGLTPGDPVDVIVSQWSDTLQGYGDSIEGTAD